MASPDKLVKALEALRHLIISTQNTDSGTRKKEKIVHCLAISDMMCNPTFSTLPNFAKLLSITLESLLQLCDDSESDVRMMADESLNRIIRALSDRHIAKIQVELQKEFKKNGAARTLRAALFKFSQLARFIRPNKGKAYIQTLTPCIVKMSEREEDSVLETLAISLEKIMEALGHFASDHEIKNLLRAFLKNLSNQSAVIRRTSASCILTIAKHSRKPNYFTSYILNALLDLLIPIQNEVSTLLLLGVFNCLRIIIPHTYFEESNSHLQSSFGVKKNTNDNVLLVGHLIQVYELCLYYVTHSDHNIINAALETLLVLLENPDEHLLDVLLSPTGISQVQIAQIDKLHSRSMSENSVAVSSQIDDHILDSTTEKLTAPDVENWIETSKLSHTKLKDFSGSFDRLSLNNYFDEKSEKTEDLPEYSNIFIGNVNDTESEVSDITHTDLPVETPVRKLEHSHTFMSDDRIDHASTKSSEDFVEKDDNLAVKEIDFGEFTDENVPLIYCCRYLVRLFLLTGYPRAIMPDSAIRVSVKSLALSCISAIIKLYPNVIGLYLDKSIDKNVDSEQRIVDIFLFYDHNDPQLRGNVRILIGSLIQAVLTHNSMNYNIWLEQMNLDEQTRKSLSLESLIDILIKGLEDESSMCNKSTLVALKSCFNQLIESTSSSLAIPILNVLPVVVKNPYWLIKVQLVGLLHNLSFTSIQYVTKNSEFQDKVIHNVLFYLLRDDDLRVRAATTKAISRIIRNLFFQKDQPNQSPVTCKAVDFSYTFLSRLFLMDVDSSVQFKYFISTMPRPYCEILNKMDETCNVEKALARIVSQLSLLLLHSSSKFLTYGCCEALSVLSNEYSTTIYNNAWECVDHNQKTSNHKSSRSSLNETTLLTQNPGSPSCGLLNLCITMMTTSTQCIDIQCQNWLISLAGNLFSGLAIRTLKPAESLNIDPNIIRKNWDIYADSLLSLIFEQLLQHVMRVLNIYAHVLDEHIPAIPTSKIMLPNLPNATSLSPMKRKNKTDSNEKNKLMSPSKSSHSAEKDDKSDKRELHRINSMGYFASSPHYMKIYELLKAAYGNYKVSLDVSVSENFLQLLKNVLKTLSQIFEMATVQETARIAEEVLHYLQSTVKIDPSGSIQCVQQLWKCFIGTNLCSQLYDFEHSFNKNSQNVSNESCTNSFYVNVFQNFHGKFARCVNLLNSCKTDKDDYIMLGCLRRKTERQSSITSKNASRNTDKSILINYIRFFNPMVVESLQQYFVTSDVRLQCQVLDLLCQLVQLRSNYYFLLDSEHVFIDFVLKQFALIEDGQIMHADLLIPKIFQFLVHLSCEKLHSKSIISIPKIINLCNDLMASGQSPVTHCIPALKPVIEDIFLIRPNEGGTSSEAKEMETTRDVLFTMLLRLIEYHQVFPMLTLIINDSRYYGSNSESWLKWSRLVLDSLLPALKLQRLALDSQDAQVAMHSLICVLHPNVFKNIDSLLNILFQDPPGAEASTMLIQRWLGTVLSIFFILISIKEDQLLNSINSTSASISFRSIFSKYIENNDPLNVSSFALAIENIPADEVFGRFIFRVVQLLLNKCERLFCFYQKNADFIIEQFAAFLLFCIHMFESGSHCRIANTTMNLLHSRNIDNPISIDEINDIFLRLASLTPTLMFEWCYLLTLLNYSDHKFWSKVFQFVNNTNNIIHLPPELVPRNHRSHCLNLEIVRVGGIILYSDYICENITDCENLTWFLVNHIETVVNLVHEPPVMELIAAIHRNSAASGLFIQAVAARCQRFDQPIFVNKLLKCLENVHPSQSGALLVFIVPNLLNCRQISLSRQAASLASRRTELLLTMTIDDVTNQLAKDDLTIIMEFLLQSKLAKKHGTFVSLLNKLASKFYDLSPLELDQGRTVKPENIRNIELNRNWYLAQVKTRCCQCTYLGSASAELLRGLNFQDITNIMGQKDFNKLGLRDCVELAINSPDGDSESGASDLLNATWSTVTKHVAYLRSILPKHHQVYGVSGRNSLSIETKFTNRLNELFADRYFKETLFEIAPTVTSYFTSKSKMKMFTDSSNEDFVKFAVVCLETIVYSISLQDSEPSIPIQYACIDAALQCSNAVLREASFAAILAQDTHTLWLCSAINAVYRLVQHLLLTDEPLPTLSKFGLVKTYENSETQSAAHACYQLATLVAWIEHLKGRTCTKIPQYLFVLIRSLIVSLARLPLVNSFILTPPDVWNQMWTVELLGKFKTQVPPLPGEYFEDIAILEQFVFRVNLLGWVSRQQFEEIWMCLLSVLSTSNFDDVHSSDEVSMLIQANSLAVQAITALLVQTLLVPVPGNPNISHLLHIPRDKILNQTPLNVKKLIAAQNTLYWKYHQNASLPGGDLDLVNIFERPNLDRVQSKNNQYSYGQVSVEYLWTCAGMVTTPPPESKTVFDFDIRTKSLAASGLDVNSCLQFLLDLYSQWLKPSSHTANRLLIEVVRSVLVLSDLFTEKAQFQWMLDMFLSRTQPPEDELLHQYVILGICKAAAVLSLELDTYEMIIRLVKNSLVSGFLPARITSLHGILYLLQSSVISNTIIGGISDEMLLIQPMAVDYVQRHVTLQNGALSQSEEHQQVMWALTFYLMENADEKMVETDLAPIVLPQVISLLAHSSITMSLQCTLLQGLERMILLRKINEKFEEQIVKLALDRLKHSNPAIAFPALQLLLVCMYTEGKNEINAPENVNGIVQIDPDLLVQVFEKITVIFDRIKKGYPFEAEVLCAVLPHLLNDFFPPSEILTKVIGEFLSPQQPHPKLLSNVVFKVFQRVIRQNHLVLLQDWVVFSLPNFTQCLPIGMSTWCLICFFISASTNPWLRSLFPHVQSRIGKYEYEDKKLLCVTGADFYRSLTSDARKKEFVEMFEKVAEQPGTPFKDLIQSL